MKRVLITGADSYIGTSFEAYIREHCPDEYTIDTVDMRNDDWRRKSFSEYDCVFHVAGIAHRKETKKNARFYYEVNRDLAAEVAKKAKTDGVLQFVFLSSMSVYGMESGVITEETAPFPKSHYGKSKWQAEGAIAPLVSDAFKICILRPPMVYGKGCKGNYRTLVKIAEHMPLLPDYKNQRSMISVEKLSEFVEKAIRESMSGIYIPQDPCYSCTSDILAKIRRELGKSYRTVKFMNPFIRLSVKWTVKGRKAFGDLIYRGAERVHGLE